MDRAADNHYATSTLEQIKAIDVASIAAPDCALFLWATSPMMPQALEVMQSWGFTYKSQIMWDKEIVGTGYWFRNRHELLLIGTRGKVPAPAMGTQWPSVMVERRRSHSVKPEWAYELIERVISPTCRESNCSHETRGLTGMFGALKLPRQPKLRSSPMADDKLDAVLPNIRKVMLIMLDPGTTDGERLNAMRVAQKYSTAPMQTLTT